MINEQRKIKQKRILGILGEEEYEEEVEDYEKKNIKDEKKTSENKKTNTGGLVRQLMKNK